MSENAIGYMYDSAGCQRRHVPHGWPGLLNDHERADREHGQPGDLAVINLMLAHVPQRLSGSDAAYNRASHVQRRRELTQDWAELITVGWFSADELVGDGDVNLGLPSASGTAKGLGGNRD